MRLNDHDLELVLQLYDRAKAHASEKNRSDWAEDFVYILGDYGYDIVAVSKEIGDHDEYLDNAVEQFLENHDEEDDDYWIEDEDADEWE